MARESASWRSVSYHSTSVHTNKDDVSSQRTHTHGSRLGNCATSETLCAPLLRFTEPELGSTENNGKRHNTLFDTALLSYVEKNCDVRHDRDLIHDYAYLRISRMQVCTAASMYGDIWKWRVLDFACCTRAANTDLGISSR